MSYIHYDPINDPSIHGDHPGALPHLHFKVEKGVIPPANTKWIWKVFWIMLIITLVELVVGFQAETWKLGPLFLKVFFISLTIVKAYYIVFAFMHLKDENRSLRATILYPFLMLIIYLVFIALTEGVYSKDHKLGMDKALLTKSHHRAEAKGDKVHDADADHSAGEMQKH
jgi:cytochrome c oxidase subunit IV